MAHLPNWEIFYFFVMPHQLVRRHRPFANYGRVLYQGYRAGRAIGNMARKWVVSKKPPTPRPSPKAAPKPVKKDASTQATSAVKKRFIATHSAGYVGKFAGKKKYQKRKVAGLFDKYGCVLKHEHSFAQTSTECVYIGHGTPVDNTFNIAIHALVRSLFHKAGYDIDDWRSTCGFSGFSIDMKYTNGGSTTQQALGFSIADTATYADIAGNLVNAIRAAITSTVPSIQWQFLELLHDTGEPGLLLLAKINLEEYYMVVDYWSILKIKNVSLAADASDGDLITNVEAQPLNGRSYTTSKWANGFQLTKRYRSPTDNVGASTLVSNKNTGAISSDSSVVWGENNSTNPYRKPPPAYAFGVEKSAVARLNPGELKVDVHKWKAKMSFNVFTEKLIFSVEATDTDGNFRPFGKSTIYALEREVEIGTGGPQIRVACEVAFVLKVRGYSIAHKMLPLTATNQ